MEDNLLSFGFALQEKSKGKRHVTTSNGTGRSLGFHVCDAFKIKSSVLDFSKLCNLCILHYFVGD